MSRKLRLRPWDAELRLKILHERKAFKKMTRRKYRIFKRNVLEKINSIESSDTASFWNLVDILKHKQEKKTSSNISPREWYDYV